MASRSWLWGCLVVGACGEPAAAPPVESPARPIVQTESSSAPAPQSAPARTDCATLRRANWVTEWSDYVARETTLGGKPLKVFGPAPGARRFVRDADVTSGNAAISGTLSGSKGSLASLFDASKIPLNVGEIVEREVPGGGVAAMCLTGEAVRLYWTTEHHKVRSAAGRTMREPFSTLYVEGLSAGEGALSVTLADGSLRSIPIVVTEAPTGRH